MKLSNSFFYTIRENVKDEDSNSGNLLVRSGFVKKTSSGVYMYLPMGWKVANKIEDIIRDEMNKTGCQELLMPALIPEDVYVASGRRKGFGNSMFSLKDRFDKPFVLGPTHEELFAMAAGMKIRSYKDMPFSLYQFETKFRDEPRPRYGLIRVREFIMKDSYTFDKDEAGLDVSYKKMFEAYKNAFNRMKIDYTIVKASTGIMGGLLSEEFQALSPIGEDTIVKCDHCDFSSNIEVSECVASPVSTEEEKTLELVETPHQQSIEEVSKFLNVDIKKTVKALLMNVDGNLVVFFVRGDRELNETKALKLVNGLELNFADDALIATSNAVPGYTGPIGLNAKIVVDRDVLTMKNFVVGGNKEGYHYINANVKDFKYDLVGDIVNVQEGDVCPVCGGRIYFEKGIEVGNTFKLGTKYSKAMNLQYSDENNKLQDVWMGSYGIGIGRCMAAIAEQNYDDKGLIWPKDVAPFKVAVVVVNTKDEAQVAAGNKIYEQLNAAGIETVLDDRNERAGVKFNDMELIGIPVRITVGKALANNQVEVKERRSGEMSVVDLDNITSAITELLEKVK